MGLNPAARALLAPAPTRVMGVLNVTPDSFSDGGRYLNTDDAISRGLEMIEQGAALVDVGGESTRPGSQRISPAEEQTRILPVVAQLSAQGVPVSVDTLHADTAKAAHAAGAVMINDVSGGLYDPEMGSTIANLDCLYVCQHWRAEPGKMDAHTHYEDVIAEVRAELGQQVQRLLDAGMRPEQIVLDPGFGFAKNEEQSWELAANLESLQESGYPILVGASRKRMIAALCQPGNQGAERDTATAAYSAWAAQTGIWAVRVHDVRGSVEAIRVVEKLKELQRGSNRQEAAGPGAPPRQIKVNPRVGK